MFVTGSVLNEDFCGVEPVTHPPEAVETRPPPAVDLERERALNNTDEAILASESRCVTLFLASLSFYILPIVYNETKNVEQDSSHFDLHSILNYAGSY